MLLLLPKKQFYWFRNFFRCFHKKQKSSKNVSVIWKGSLGSLSKFRNDWPIMTSIIKSPKFRHFAKTKYRRLDENLTFVALLFTALNSEHWFIKTHFQDCGGVALSWMHLCALEGEWSDAFVSLAPSPSLRYFKQKSFASRLFYQLLKIKSKLVFLTDVQCIGMLIKQADPLYFAHYLTTFLPWVKSFIDSAVWLVVLRECSAARRCCAILQQSIREIHRGDFPGDFWSTTRFINFCCGAHCRWFVSGSQPLIRDTLVCFRHTTGGCMCGTKPWLSLQAVMSMCLHATVIACGVFHRW